jgi:hypothetical protein
MTSAHDRDPEETCPADIGTRHRGSHDEVSREPVAELIDAWRGRRTTRR